jgi:hypothetical protein
VIHGRLHIAAGLDGQTLYLECFHPSASSTASKFFCTSLGTDGLHDVLDDIDDRYVGQIERMGNLFSRFRPQHKEPDVRVVRRHPAGDIPGSRTHGASSSGDIARPQSDDDPSNFVVTETVTVDAHDLFSQLTTLAFLGKREASRGLLVSMQEVCEGTIRVWRDWLAKHCECKKWTDGEPIAVHHDTPGSPQGGKGSARARVDSVTSNAGPTADSGVLWVNTRAQNVGIRFKVKEQSWRRNKPILYSSDVEVAVSYRVQFEGMREIEGWSLIAPC